MKKLFLFISPLLFVTISSNAQRRFILQHEIGATVGIVNTQSDFLAKGPLDGKATINGYNLEGSHYLHILPRRYGANSILTHTILKSSLAVNISSFNNDGYGVKDKPLADPIEKTDSNILLGKLTSETLLISFDNEVQYYFKDLIKYLHQYNKFRGKRSKRRRRRRSKTNDKINPYIALGVGVNYLISNTDYSYNGNIISNGTGIVYPDNYQANFISDQNTIVISGNFGFGARYKAGRNYDIVARMGFKYFLSDWIDGVNPDLSGNSINDFNSTISIGAIYHLF